MVAIEKQHNSEPQFLKGGGEMGEIIRKYDWASNPLGEPETWPQSLRTTLSIIINSKFPMFLFWGPELICFYNDAYRPSLGNTGKHPAIGLKGKDLWPEIWKDIHPIIKHVLQGGEANWSEDQLLPIYRNGHMEDVYWTFSYSPVTDEKGEIAGVFVTCTETTGKIISEKKLLAANKDLAESRNDLLFTIEAAGLGTFDLNPLTGRFTGNDLLKSWFGLSPDEEIPLPAATDVIAEADRERVLKAIAYALDYASAGKYDIEYTIANPKNPIARLVRAKGLAIFNDAKQAIRLSGTLQDITEEKRVLSAFEEANEHFSLLADNISQLAWMTDETGYIFWYNKRWYEYTGTTLEEMQGWGWEKVHHPDHLERVVAKWTANIKNGEIWEDLFPLKSANGEYGWFLSRAVPLKDENGKIIRWIGTNTDVTEQRQDEIRKNDFIGMVSHELKTPLTSLTALIQVADAKLKNNEDKFLAGAMGKANAQVKKMGAMINGFLNVSRLESGKILIDKTSFNLEVLLKEVISEHELTVSTHIFHWELCDKVKVYADRDKIGSVISNLLSNAVKYSPKGKLVTVQCRRVENNVEIGIKDEGMGIKTDDLKKVFNRYYRVETDHNKHISGFGIGLYLSAEIINRHNGKIWAESETGAGSTFYFSLPLA